MMYELYLMSEDDNALAFFTGTSLVVTVVRSIGNNHSHLGTWCWAQTGFTGKVIS